MDGYRTVSVIFSDIRCHVAIVLPRVETAARALLTDLGAALFIPPAGSRGGYTEVTQVRPTLTAMDTETAVELLNDRIEEAEGVLRGGDGPDFKEWKARTRLTLVRIFGEEHHLVSNFDDTRYSLGMWTDRTPDSAFRSARDAGIKSVISLLKAAVFEREQLANDTPVGNSDFDPELWEHVAHLVDAGKWGQVATETAVFLESKVRQWAGLPAADHSKNLMVKVFKPDGGKFPCGQTDGEELGWQQLATGFVQAIGNVDRHRIQDRDDARTYALGVLGTASLLLTQLRHQHANRFRA